MKVATDEEVRQYLSQFPDLRCDGKIVGFVARESKGITVNLRLPEPHQLLYLAHLAACLVGEE